MGLRDKINQNPRLVTIITAVVAVIAIVLIIYSLRSSGPAIGPAKGMYFTVDDGATWFVGSFDKIPPFEHEGKQAVRAHVYRSEKDGKEFVGWLERYTPRGQAILKHYYSDPANKDSRPPWSRELEDQTEIKKPGDAKWILQPRASQEERVRIRYIEGAIEVQPGQD